MLSIAGDEQIDVADDPDDGAGQRRTIGANPDWNAAPSQDEDSTESVDAVFPEENCF